MDAALKKGVALVVVVFIGFYLFTDPTGLAGFTRDGADAIWSGLQRLFDALQQFIRTLTA
ncbi:hypothetical protein [Marmoricola endophyticus]|nr:hypothetical protein [Marmoricola endophyticus]